MIGHLYRSKITKVKNFKRIYSTTAEEYYQQRIFEIKEFEKNTQKYLYPTKFNKSTISYEDFKENFKELKTSEKYFEVTHTIIGRIVHKREASSKLIFYSVEDSNQNQIQIMATKNSFKEDFEINRIIRKGDIVSFTGSPGKTGTGELSLIPIKIEILSPCLHQLPLKLEDLELRYRNRSLDFIINKDIKKNFIIRAKTISFLRNFLEKRGFIEVETPIISQMAGGAIANPFETHLNALDMDLKLRISPELFLKKLIIGGFDKVYEIGKVFRNEGVDTTHNPEFTSCEFYEAYSNYEDLMKLTEEFLNELVQYITGSSILKVGEHEINFQAPFKRVSFIKSIEENIGKELPKEEDPNALEILFNLCNQNSISIEKKKAHYGYLLDKLAGHFIESKCIQPTFLCDHPISLSPLAKSHDDNPRQCQRFELFLNGKEICNAYSELNDPRIQRMRFEDQLKKKKQGDDEAHEIDEHFIESMELGLPPTGGWGLGIDRLVMLLTNSSNIRDVLFFPLMKEKKKE